MSGLREYSCSLNDESDVGTEIGCFIFEIGLSFVVYFNVLTMPVPIRLIHYLCY